MGPEVYGVEGARGRLVLNMGLSMTHRSNPVTINTANVTRTLVNGNVEKLYFVAG